MTERHPVRQFLQLLWEKLEDDDAPFLAAAIAWGVLFALVPLLMLGIGLTGFVLSARFEDPTQAVVGVFATALPTGGNEMDFTGLLERLVGEVMANRAGFTVFGSLVFVWLATRLSGSLRSSLYRVFDVGVRRNILHGKAFDVLAVLLGAVLVTLNMSTTLLITTAWQLGVEVFDWAGPTLSYAQRLGGVSVAFVSIWMLFVIVYRYLPARKTPWKTALIAATISALGHELLKLAFSWYVTDLADYTSTLGNLATIAVLLLWIYYEALVFILGGEMAQVYAMQKAHSVEER